MSAALEVRGLCAGYGSAQVLFGVDLSVAESEMVAVLGRNGMGKSTLVRSILGLTAVSEGMVAVVPPLVAKDFHFASVSDAV